MSNLGGLGLAEEHRGIPAIGVEYVVATPQGRAVLRPLRYPL